MVTILVFVANWGLGIVPSRLDSGICTIFCNQIDCTASQIRDGINLKLTFHRCVDLEDLVMCQDLYDVISDVSLCYMKDYCIWLLEPSSRYWVKSFYDLINFLCSPLHMEDIEPSKYTCLVWLIVNNKSLVRDSLAKCKPVGVHPACSVWRQN